MLHVLNNVMTFYNQVTAACKKHGGFYLGSIGGPAAILAQNCIKKVEVMEYPELGENINVLKQCQLGIKQPLHPFPNERFKTLPN